ncbi:MAG TPA: hypothetical protein VJ914_35530 [Pseudonocardiaceae bacterium]|nr:hypothetical protein [Pseudonocardiaceae bacterium]
MRKSLIALGALALSVPAVPAVAAPSAPTSHASLTQVLLPTGDRVNVRTLANGARSAAVLPSGTGIAHTFIGLNLAGDQYEIPATAVPYLGNGLELSQFDVTALAANPPSNQNPAAAKAFGAELTQHYLAGKAPLPGAAHTASPAAPNFAMHTVTIAGNDTNGKPDTGALAVLVNVDDSARYAAPNQLYQGTAKFSVPAGNYFAAVAYYDTDANGNVTAEHDVFDSQLVVSGDQTLRLDANRATSKLTMVTPRPTLNAGGAFYLTRQDAKGAAIGLDLAFGPGVPVWVSPQPKPVTVGTLYSYPQMWLTSPPAPGTPYAYNLQYLASGTIPAQRYVVKAKSLATINTGYYSDFATAGLIDVTTTFPFEARLGTFAEQDVTQNMPAAQTLYVPGDPTLSRGTEVVKYTVNVGAFELFYGMQVQPLTNYHAGQTVTENWNQFPLHPAAVTDPGAPSDAEDFMFPGATRSGDTENFYLLPFSDNDPGHQGPAFYGESRDTIGGNWELDQNGSKIAGAALAGGTNGAFQFDPQVPVSAAPSTLHLTLDATRTGPMYALSTASHTEWTWPSTHQQGTALPAPWTCSDRSQGTDCSVEPLLSAGYHVDNLDLTGTVSREVAQGVDLTFGHIAGATASPITGATVRYSTDDGATWQNATVTSTGNGGYHAAYVINAFNAAYVSLKVTAHDAAGGAITETTTRAYRLI